MPKPVTLIIANECHRIVDVRRQHTESGQEMPPEEAIAESMARNILYGLSQEGSVAMVWKALAAVGGPDGAMQMLAQADAASEAQEQEGAST